MPGRWAEWDMTAICRSNPVSSDTVAIGEWGTMETRRSTPASSVAVQIGRMGHGGRLVDQPRIHSPPVFRTRIHCRINIRVEWTRRSATDQHLSGMDPSKIVLVGRTPHQRRNGRARFLPGLPEQESRRTIEGAMFTECPAGRPISASILQHANGIPGTSQTRESQRQVRRTPKLSGRFFSRL